MFIQFICHLVFSPQDLNLKGPLFQRLSAQLGFNPEAICCFGLHLKVSFLRASVSAFIESLQTRYGHFGRKELDLPWEKPKALVQDTRSETPREIALDTSERGVALSCV